jgi:hypothetical protein
MNVAGTTSQHKVKEMSNLTEKQLAQLAAVQIKIDLTPYKDWRAMKAHQIVFNAILNSEG